ncbi:Ig-like domain-containing protein [Myxococcota bacterium]|nr:Ig-like domain-containing protein [Myxococcota bacterium]
MPRTLGPILAGALTAALPGVALANGQTTHVWITHAAVEALPDGDLRDLLTREDLLPALVHGTMFPDGGYPLGDDYAEIAHWEPFQGPYLEWIRAEYGPHFEGEGALHVAFLMGLASHGMADQTFDSMYVERCEVYDAYRQPHQEAWDTASDVLMASLTGAQQVPEQWVPYETLVDLYAQVAGYEVDVSTLESGQLLLELAIWGVGKAGANPEAVAAYAEQFPWGSAHLLDADVPGSPPVEAEIVALYWQELWDRLHGEERLDPAVIATLPADGAAGHPTSAASIESWVTVVLARGLERDTVVDGAVVATDSTGTPHPVTLDLYYGQGSHVVHVKPAQDWADDEDYTVTVQPGIATVDGLAVEEPWSFAFSTRAPDTADPPAEQGDPSGEGCGGCGTGGGRGSPGLLLVAAVAARALGRRRAGS